MNVCVAGQSEHRGHLDAATVQVPIFWTDMLDQGVRLPRDYPGLVQSWKCWGSVGPGREQIGKAWGSAGAPAVQSTCWYLDWDSPAEELLRHPLRGTSEVPHRPGPRPPLTRLRRRLLRRSRATLATAAQKAVLCEDRTALSPAPYLSPTP